jgi:hypothetical protein
MDIKIGKKIINWKPWKQRGIWQISDICKENGMYIDWNELLIQYGPGLNYLNWIQLKKAIPKEWIVKVMEDTKEPYVKEEEPYIQTGNRKIYIKHLECKIIYWFLINARQVIPIAIKKWEIEFPNFQEVEDKMWQEIFKNPYICTSNTYIQSLQFKIIHRVITCNKKLYDFKIKLDPLCDYCNQTDDIIHHFITCEYTMKFWISFWAWWRNVTEININFTEHEIIEGIIFGFAPIDDHFIAMNYVIYESKKYIYQQKLNKLGTSFVEFLIKLKYSLYIEQKRHEIYAKNKLYKAIEFIVECL